MSVQRVISGGQTGVDRAALDVSLELGVPCGGFCPAGRGAEDGIIPRAYPLIETASPDPAERTDRNVQLADAILIIAAGELTGGTALTRERAEAHGRPYVVADPTDPNAAETIRAWLARHDVSVLDVAGPRASEAPGIYEQARALLSRVLGRAMQAGAESP